MTGTRTPEGYSIEEGGLYKKTGAKSKKLVNAVPEVISWKKKVFHGTQGEERYVDYVEIKFRIDGKQEESSRWYELKDVISGEFINNIPYSVIIEPRCSNAVKEVFRWYIQHGMKEEPDVVEDIYPYGWGLRDSQGSRVFHWEKDESKGVESEAYQIAMEAVKLIIAGSDALNAVFLAAIHGPLMEPLLDAGVVHNFTTDISGKTGVGKSTLTRLAVNGTTGEIVSLSSDRRPVLKMLQNSTDMTFVLDDYSKTESGRTRDRLRQTVTEVIQAQCDSARLIVGNDIERKKNNVHIIVNREEEFKNLSTINRTYWVEMKEKLPSALHDRVKEFSGERMLVFIQSLINFMEAKYAWMVDKIKSDYRLFLSQARENYKDDRIADTVAVQKVLQMILVRYCKHMELPEIIIQQVDCSLGRSINRVGHDMCDFIDDMNGNAVQKRAISKLAQIIENLGNPYKVAKTEKEYLSAIERGSPEVIGCCVNKGHLSYRLGSMVDLINSGLDDESEHITPKLLSRELIDYGLAHIDRDKKLSTCWHTKNKMHHVNVELLLKLFRDEPYEPYDGIAMDNILSYFSLDQDD